MESAALLEAGTPTFLQHGDVVFACLVREVEGGRADVTTPYGYGGPVGGPDDSFARAYEEWCAERRVVTTFVRFHPLYANHRGAHGFHVERLGDTIAWPLVGDLFANMHRHHRRVVRKAQAARVEVEAAEGVGDFVALYERTMARRGAEEFYFFGADYWPALERVPLVRLDARSGGELVASALFLASAPWLHYHLGASSKRGRELGASHLVLFEAARLGQVRGFATLHLGGGVGGREDSLFEYKLRFAPEGRREFCVGKAVHDAGAYRSLTGAEPSFEGFFPAYRR